jgi:hypothetical protein
VSEARGDITRGNGSALAGIGRPAPDDRAILFDVMRASAALVVTAPLWKGAHHLARSLRECGALDRMLRQALGTPDVTRAGVGKHGRP